MKKAATRDGFSQWTSIRELPAERPLGKRVAGNVWVIGRHNANHFDSAENLTLGQRVGREDAHLGQPQAYRPFVRLMLAGVNG